MLTCWNFSIRCKRHAGQRDPYASISPEQAQLCVSKETRGAGPATKFDSANPALPSLSIGSEAIESLLSDPSPRRGFLTGQSAWSRCRTRRGAEFSRFLPLAIDEGESQSVDGLCVPFFRRCRIDETGTVFCSYTELNHHFV